MITLDEFQRLLTRLPYHQWLGLEALACSEDAVEIKARWREEWVADPVRRHTHGGILAALIDAAGLWALVGRLERGVPTINMQVDYHAAAMPGDLIARGRVIKAGRTFSVCEASIVDLAGTLIASGRGTYYTRPTEAKQPS
jgi:uncharacterized protein (TIGR00369 family)